METELYRQMRELENSHWWFTARRRIIETVMMTLDLHPSSRILDVGTGSGGNLEMLARFGRVTGLEHDDTAADLAAARGIAPILKGSLPDGLPFSPGEFDLILLLDVLEHVDDDRSAVRRLEQVLAPGGTMVLTVPAFPFLWSYHDVQHHHRRRYRYRELRAVLREAGLRIRILTFFNTWLFPAIVATRFLRKMKSSVRVGADTGIPAPAMNALLRTVFSSERHVVTRMKLPFGASLLAVACKDER